MYAACDNYGNECLMMESIVDYRNNDKAVIFPGQKVVHRGWSFMHRSTVGWQLCVKWRDVLPLWQALKDLKEYQPVETAEYSVDREIDLKPVLNWWLRAVLKKRLRIISLVNKSNTRYLKKTRKFGIEVPKSVAQVYPLDENNGNKLWSDVISK